jgi:hypothetical protein
LQISLSKVLLSLLFLGFFDKFLDQLRVLLLSFLADVLFDHFIENPHFRRFELLSVGVCSLNFLQS